MLIFKANMYVAFATGTALYGTASIFYRFTGSIFNPSVSLALCVCRVIKPVRFLCRFQLFLFFPLLYRLPGFKLILIVVCFAQMLGGVVACFILSGLLPGQASINLELSDEVSVVQALFIEMFATTTLILTVLMLGVGELSSMSNNSRRS
jgi:aquaporin related protein